MLGLTSAVARFGADAKAKLSNPGATGEPEDQLRAPLEGLFADLAELCGLKREWVAAVGESSLSTLKTRPDYAITLRNVLVGFVEIKAPGKGADPRRYKGHDKDQWEKLRRQACAGDWRTPLFREANDARRAYGNAQTISFGKLTSAHSCVPASKQYSLSAVAISIAKAPTILPRNASKNCAIVEFRAPKVEPVKGVWWSIGCAEAEYKKFVEARLGLYQQSRFSI